MLGWAWVRWSERRRMAETSVRRQERIAEEGRVGVGVVLGDDVEPLLNPRVAVRTRAKAVRVKSKREDERRARRVTHHPTPTALLMASAPPRGSSPPPAS